MNNTTLLRSNLQEEIVKLKQQPGKDITIGSISIASQLTLLGFIDEYHFVVHPIVRERGPRLFESDGLKDRLQLELVGSKKFRSGVVALHYKKLTN